MGGIPHNKPQADTPGEHFTSRRIKWGGSRDIALSRVEAPCKDENKKRSRGEEESCKSRKCPER